MPLEEVKHMAYGPRMEVYQDSAGYYRWRLKASNGEKIASSGEAFSSQAAAQQAARTVIATCKQL